MGVLRLVSDVCYDCGREELLPPLLLKHWDMTFAVRLPLLRCVYLIFWIRYLHRKGSGKYTFPINCTSLVHFKWGGGAEVWFLNTSAVLFCCWLTQTAIQFGFCNCGEPFTLWLSHGLLHRKHIVFSSTSPGQSHHGFFWNVCQSDHYVSPLMIFP